MSEQPEQLRPALNWDVALQIERAVSEFEASWRKGGSTEIEQVLERHSSVPARELFCALLETELELRQLNREAPSPQKWEERFPQWHPEIGLIFTQSQSVELLTESNFSPLPKAGGEFGRYRIRREVGRGAMGVVFEAEMIETSEIVALKVVRLPKSFSDSERVAAVCRFQTEASATSALQHPHVISVRDVGEVDGVPYFTMPFISGGTLKQLRRQAPIEPVRAARLIEAAARALHHAHRAGRFHRDIKPSNLLLGPNDHVFVSDFGISMHRDELGRGPNHVGTPLYMSPEQSAGTSNLIDGRSDVFSLGIVLYELLTGTHPFDTPLATPVEVVHRICHLPVPPLRERSEVPRRLEDICLKALRRRPEERYSTAADFVDALAEFIQSHNQRPSSVRTNRTVLFAAAALVVVAIGIAVGLRMRTQKLEPTQLESTPQPPLVQDIEPSNVVEPAVDRVAAEWQQDDVAGLINRLLVESSDDIRAALIIALAERDVVQYPVERRAELYALLGDWYEHRPSPLLHSAIEWLAKRWDNSGHWSLTTTDQRLSLADELRARRFVLKQRLVPRASGWYHPMHGPTMVVIPERRNRETRERAETTWKPTPATPDQPRASSRMAEATTHDQPSSPMPRTFAIATTEVTEYQFHYAHETYWLNPSPTNPGRPRSNITWQEAAWFCNRLSELEGIPPVKQCYVEFADDKGQKHLRAKVNALDLPGYRLPTADEWEFVRRGATAKTWNQSNPLGVFGPHDNAAIWLHDSDRDGSGRRSRATSNRGGETTHPTVANLATIVSATTNPMTVLRVARTIPPLTNDPKRLVDVFVGPPTEPDRSRVVKAFDAAKTHPTLSESDFVLLGDGEVVPLGAWPRGPFSPRRFRVTNVTDQSVTVVKTYLGGLLEIRDPLPETISPHASAEFSVAIPDLGVGPRSGDLVLRFKSGDREWAYFGKVAGNLYGTTMSVFEGGVSGRDRSLRSFDFQTVPLDAQVAHRFGVFCQGDEPLRINSIEVPDGFALEPGWDSVVEVGKLSGFRVRVNTSKAGKSSGRIRLRSNDPVEPVFDFPVQARVSDSPRFSVIGVFRSGQWLFDHNRDGQPDEEIFFGKKEDKPVTGDVNGDGICDIGVCRATSDGKLNWEFHLRGVKDQPPSESYTFGKVGDFSFLADPIGDGRLRPTIVGPSADQRELVWKFDTDGDGQENKEFSYLFGKANAIPVIGDWNGDGISDAGSVIVGDQISKFQNRWRLRLNDGSATEPILFGSIISIPITGDWDADGRWQIGVLEELGRYSGRFEFHLDYQSGGLPRLEIPFGQTDDVPVVLSGNTNQDRAIKP